MQNCHKPTPEQQAVINSPALCRLTVANAGSGKTTLMAMLYAELFLAEERRYIQQHPNAKLHENHLCAEQDLKALIQGFEAITFTQKAAAELDLRIRKCLLDRGCTIPLGEAGQEAPWRFARTIDSKILQTFFHPLFFKCHYYANLPRKNRADALADVAKKNPAAVAWITARRAKDAYSREPGWESIQFWQAWGCLLVAQDQTALIELVLLEHLGWIEGVLGALPQMVRVRLHSTMQSDWVSSATKPLCQPLLKELGHACNAANARFAADRNTLAKEEQNLTAPDREQLLERLRPFHEKERLVRDFSTAYELARRKGYRPLEGLQTLCTAGVLEAIAEMSATDQGPVTLETFHRLCTKLEQAKLELGLLDFVDFTEAVVQGFKTSPFLLEAGQATPKLGFRKRHTIIDETQDNDPAQWQLVNLLRQSLGAGNTLNLVGDPAQSIYQFRGAAPEGMDTLLQGSPASGLETFGLSHCFRSAPPIVSLGNEVIATLSQYRERKQPSQAVHAQLAGSIELWAPLNQFEEAQRVFNLAKSKRQAGETVLVLFRSNGERSPCLRALERDGLLDDGMIQFLSTHKAKGLEADCVILIGCSGGRWPDPRGDQQQEVNLLYVAVTRPRTQLIISCPLQERVLGKNGEYEDQLLGPSPFISQLQTLQDLWSQANLSLDLLRQGVESHEAAVQYQQQLRASRLEALQAEAVLHRAILKAATHDLAVLQRVPDRSASTAEWVRQQTRAGTLQPEHGDTLQAIEAELASSSAGNSIQHLTPLLRKCLARMSERCVGKTDNVVPQDFSNDLLAAGAAQGWFQKRGHSWLFTADFLALEKFWRALPLKTKEALLVDFEGPFTEDHKKLLNADEGGYAEVELQDHQFLLLRPAQKAIIESVHPSLKESGDDFPAHFLLHGRKPKATTQSNEPAAQRPPSVELRLKYANSDRTVLLLERQQKGFQPTLGAVLFIYKPKRQATPPAAGGSPSLVIGFMSQDNWHGD